MKRARVVGVLGGMGPDATVDFMAKVIALTPAERDQDHIHMLVDHDPRVPSRQNPSVADDARIREMLAQMAERLEAAGADFLVMVCNTAHGWLDRARERVSIPFVGIVDETVAAIEARHRAARRVGVLATPACLDVGLYQDALEDSGFTALPLEGDARHAFMALVDRVKAGEQGEEVRRGMVEIARGLIERGAEVIIAGCTEVPLVLESGDLTVPLVSSTDELARRTVELALGDALLAGDHRH